MGTVLKDAAVMASLAVYVAAFTWILCRVDSAVGRIPGDDESEA